MGPAWLIGPTKIIGPAWLIIIIIIIIIIINSLSSVSLSEDSSGDAPKSREIQTAPLTQQDQSRQRGGGAYFGCGALAKKSVLEERVSYGEKRREKKMSL